MTLDILVAKVIRAIGVVWATVVVKGILVILAVKGILVILVR